MKLPCQNSIFFRQILLDFVNFVFKFCDIVGFEEGFEVFNFVEFLVQCFVLERGVVETTPWGAYATFE